MADSSGLGMSERNIKTGCRDGVQVATGGEFVELDPITLKPLSRFTHKDIDSRFRVRRQQGPILQSGEVPTHSLAYW